jgi:4-amino-4-deoxy-L-arabinose transferase-like glycosyltransferase
VISRGVDVGETGSADAAHSKQRSSRPAIDRALLIVVLVAAAIVRSAWAIAAALPPESDFLTFLTTAQLIGRGHWWPDAYGWSWQGPAYPLLIAPLTLLGQAMLPAIYTMNVVLGVLTVALVHRLGRDLFGSRAGLLAAAITAALPGLWLWTPIVSAENLSAPIFVGIAVLLAERPRKWRMPLAGVLTGILLFARPSTLVFGFVVLLSVAWLAPRGEKRTSAVLFAAGIAVSVGMFAGLNLRAGGPALPIGGSGWQPWLVYNERATGAWFPAQERDDYPFHGLEDDPTMATIVRSAQIKLATQFALLNPGDVMPGIVQRHINNWRSDEAGLDWTVRRQGASALALSVGPALEALVNRYYLAVIMLALIGAWKLATRPAVVVVLLLPLTYLVMPAVIAEGNARYHVNGLAFLAILAGGALAASSNRIRLLALGSAALALAAPPILALGPSLVFAIVVLGGVRLTIAIVSGVRATLAGGQRGRVLVALGAGVVAAELAAALVLVGARQTLIDWSLTQPTGWKSYDTGGSSRAGGDEISLRPSDVATRFTKVSFPDAAILEYPASAAPGERIGVARTFPDLEIGSRYVVYLQIFASSPEGGSERLTIRLNGHVVAEPVVAPATSAAWHDVIVPWTADLPFASVEIESTASGRAGATEVLIRSAHVYPKY